MPAEVTTRLPREPAAIAEARRALGPIDPVVDATTIATLKLLVSELVTNSVRHGEREDDEIKLWVSASPSTVRVEVTDSGPGFEPQPPTPDQDDGSGGGLHLVEQMTDRWGTTRTGRPCVWFEIDLEGNGGGARPRAGRP